MNSKNGLGDLDIRYIDALIDNMGSTGYLSGLGKSGHMVANSTSLIGGIGGEDPGMSLRAHPNGYNRQPRRNGGGNYRR